MLPLSSLSSFCFAALFSPRSSTPRIAPTPLLTPPLVASLSPPLSPIASSCEGDEEGHHRSVHRRAVNGENGARICSLLSRIRHRRRSPLSLSLSLRHSLPLPRWRAQCPARPGQRRLLRLTSSLARGGRSGVVVGGSSPVRPDHDGAASATPHRGDGGSDGRGTGGGGVGTRAAVAAAATSCWPRGGKGKSRGERGVHEPHP